MTKNPFMSAYLSAANRVANTAHQPRDKRVQAPVQTSDHQHGQRLGGMHGPPSPRARRSQRASARAADTVSSSGKIARRYPSLDAMLRPAPQSARAASAHPHEYLMVATAVRGASLFGELQVRLSV